MYSVPDDAYRSAENSCEFKSESISLCSLNAEIEKCKQRISCLEKQIEELTKINKQQNVNTVKAGIKQKEENVDNENEEENLDVDDNVNLGSLFSGLNLIIKF